MPCLSHGQLYKIGLRRLEGLGGPHFKELFNQLSSIGLQCLMQYKDKLEEITELVEETRRKTCSDNTVPCLACWKQKGHFWNITFLGLMFWIVVQPAKRLLVEGTCCRWWCPPVSWQVDRLRWSPVVPFIPGLATNVSNPRIFSECSNGIWDSLRGLCFQAALVFFLLLSLVPEFSHQNHPKKHVLNLCQPCQVEIFGCGSISRGWRSSPKTILAWKLGDVGGMGSISTPSGV